MHEVGVRIIHRHINIHKKSNNSNIYSNIGNKIVIIVLIVKIVKNSNNSNYSNNSNNKSNNYSNKSIIIVIITNCKKSKK